VEVYQGPERRKLLDFTTESDSGKLPGAAPMLGVGAAAQGGVTAGMAVANAAVSGVKTYKSDGHPSDIGVLRQAGLDSRGSGA
jgi:hypothetical protein